MSLLVFEILWPGWNIIASIKSSTCFPFLSSFLLFVFRLTSRRVRLPTLHHPPFFHLPFSPSLLCSGLPLSASCLRDVIRGTQNQERTATILPMSRRLMSKYCPTCKKKPRPCCVYLYHSHHPVTFSSLSPSLNFQFSLTGRWHGRLMFELITHSMLYLIILYILTCHQNMKAVFLPGLVCDALDSTRCCKRSRPFCYFSLFTEQLISCSPQRFNFGNAGVK